MTASRRNIWRNTLLAAGIAVCAAAAIMHAHAQTPAPKDFLGLIRNHGKPLEIEAALAEPEADGVERYGGNETWVNVRLGGTTLKSHFVTVYYERGPETANVSTAELRKVGLTHILKLEASGDVLLTYEDQTAVGDKAAFDILANKVWFDGNVTLTQKQKVYTGVRLFANLTTGGFAIAGPLLPRNGLKEPSSPVFERWEQPKGAR
jgi:lipopolysaccharide export system protein LptA